MQAGQGAEPADVVLQRNTSWVVPGEVMGSSTPKRRCGRLYTPAPLGTRSSSSSSSSSFHSCVTPVAHRITAARDAIHACPSREQILCCLSVARTERGACCLLAWWCREQIFALATLGVRLVITLTEEEPLPAAWFQGTGVANAFVPVPNYEPPSVEQMERILGERPLPWAVPHRAATCCARACLSTSFLCAAATAAFAFLPRPAGLMEECVAAGGAALVHCGGGKGRAGTALACYLLRHGLDPRRRPRRHAAHDPNASPNGEPAMAAEEAVRQIRAMRPGSIETAQQQRFVGAWSKHVWKLHAAAQAAVNAAAAAPALVAPAAAAQAATAAAPAPAPAPAPDATRAQRRGPSAAGAAAAAQSDAGPRVANPGAALGHPDVAELPGGAYPRTPHLPFSPQVAADDCVMAQHLAQQLLLSQPSGPGSGAPGTSRAGEIACRGALRRRLTPALSFA